MGLSIMVVGTHRAEMDPMSGSDEGEIIESEPEKATTSLPSVNGTTVDRGSRTRVGASKSSEEHERPHSYSDHVPSRSYHEPPYAEKRTRHDDDDDDGDGARYDRRAPDRRQFKVHYEGRSPDEPRHSRRSYLDRDHRRFPGPDLQYDEPDGEDRYRDKRPRTRSRSPATYGRGDYRRPGWETGDPTKRRHSIDRRDAREDLRPTTGRYQRGTESRDGRARASPAALEPGSRVTSSNRRRSPALIDHGRRSRQYVISHLEAAVALFLTIRRDDTSIPQQRPESNATDTRESEPIDEATLIEQRRKRREAIKAKYQGQSQASPLLVHALHVGNKLTVDAPSTPDVEMTHPTQTSTFDLQPCHGS